MATDRLIFRQKCKSNERLSKATLIAMLTEGSRQREWFEALEDDQWTITSFNSKTREACVQVDSGVKSNTITVILPAIDATPTDQP